jgi:hypothetical protein
MTRVHMLHASRLVIVLSGAVALVGAAPGPAPSADAAAPCCFANERFAGTCKVVPGKGETCAGILAYLNDPTSSGKAYCDATTIRGGWTEASCSTPTPPPASLGQLAWMAGDWAGEFDGGCSDERWTAPVANTLMGMARYSKDAKVEFYEFQAIEARPDGLTLMLRHFKPGMIAWEDKDKPLAFRLVSMTPTAAVFEHADPAKPARLTYQRSEDGQLTLTVQHWRDGSPAVDAFRYTRIDGAQPCDRR